MKLPYSDPYQLSQQGSSQARWPVKAPERNHQGDQIQIRSHLGQQLSDSMLVIPRKFERIKELDNLVDVNLAVGVFASLRGVDQGENFADEVQGLSSGQPFVFVSVQLKLRVK